MSRRVALLLCLALTTAGVTAVAGDVSEGNWISGPLVHENLAVYFVHGSAGASTVRILTLEEALDSGQVIVHETGDVNELAVENRSDFPIFIQAGDIVKGGRQDRAMALDMIVKPHSGKLPIPSFCVEQGRWSQRGGESDAEFGSSKYVLSSKGLKIAALAQRSQSEVWSSVGYLQSDLEGAVAAPVADERSASSLQLALENENVQKRIDEYVKAIDTVISDQADIVGMVFAVNGVINSGDIYRTPELFRKQWSKLIKASATEALAGLEDERSSEPPTSDSVAAWLDRVGGQEVTREEREGGTHVKIREGKGDIGIESAEADSMGGWIHQSYIKK